MQPTMENMAQNHKIKSQKSQQNMHIMSCRADHCFYFEYVLQAKILSVFSFVHLLKLRYSLKNSEKITHQKIYYTRNSFSQPS